MKTNQNILLSFQLQLKWFHFWANTSVPEAPLFSLSLTLSDVGGNAFVVWRISVITSLFCHRQEKYESVNVSKKFQYMFFVFVQN